MNSKAKQRAAATGQGRRAPAQQAPVERVGGPDRPLRHWRADMPSDAVESHNLAVDEADRGKRLDRFLVDRLGDAAGLSRTRLQALIASGAVTLDGRPIMISNHKLEGFGQVSVEVPAPLPAEPVAETIALTIVFEDEHLLVLDKPAGLVVHPAAGHESGTLVNALLAHCGDSLSGIGGVRRPGIVHRIDKDTSGLMVVAKTDLAHRGLAALFADHGRSGSLRRAYTAFAWGIPGTRGGTVDCSLGRDPHHRDRMAVVPDDRGRHAVTHWVLQEEFGGIACAVRCELETGRTHQIRVHLAHIGHPLIGDPVYGAGFRTKVARLPAPAQGAVAALGRQALHASLLGFDHPATGHTLLFQSAPPPELALLRAALAGSSA